MHAHLVQQLSEVISLRFSFRSQSRRARAQNGQSKLHSQTRYWLTAEADDDDDDGGDDGDDDDAADGRERIEVEESLPVPVH